MVNALWAAMLGGGLLWGAATGHLQPAANAVFQYALAGLEAGIELIAIIAVWFGLSRVAEASGILHVIVWAVQPLFRRLFPEVPRRHPALASMAMNLAANFLGLANAATPFGLQAMRELQQINPRPDAASPAMIKFLAMNSACVTLVPSTAVALRAAAGSADPGAVILPAALATSVALAALLLANAYWFRNSGRLR